MLNIKEIYTEDKELTKDGIELLFPIVIDLFKDANVSTYLTDDQKRALMKAIGLEVEVLDPDKEIITVKYLYVICTVNLEDMTLEVKYDMEKLPIPKK